MRISILGSGGWGTALSVLSDSCGHTTVLWGAFADEIAAIEKNRVNPLLAGIEIPQTVRLTADLCQLHDSAIYIIATPSFAVRETAGKLRAHIAPQAVVVSVAKGFEKGSLKRFSQVIAEELPEHPVVILSGPSHAEEVGRQLPTSVVAASVNLAAARLVQDALSNENFRIYTNDDVAGVEIGAALKNIIAMAAGVCDGMGLGDNTIAALITRGINEIAALGVQMGARRDTFAGLSGIGDLIVTCTSRHSRNRRFGKALGSGVPVQQALESVGMTVESYYATACAKKLADQYQVEMPIVEECYNMLYCGGDAKASIKKLMNRSKKSEMAHNWEVQ